MQLATSTHQVQPAQLCFLFNLEDAPRALVRPTTPPARVGFALRIQVRDARCTCGAHWTFEMTLGRKQPECPRCGEHDVELDGPAYWLEGTR
jgi:Zn finger protein HypA/HybF involved in hydrogenase expression